MGRSLVADLGLGPEIWLFLTFLALLTVFFKFNRIWSIRNLDLLLLYTLSPGLMRLVGNSEGQLWQPFVLLFIGSAFWLARCILDLGLTRRPLLEPNLNMPGLACTAVGLLGLLVAEAVLLPLEEGEARNPASPNTHPASVAASPGDESVATVLRQAPLPTELKRRPPQVIVSRVLAGLSHLVLVALLYRIGVKFFDRPISGLAMGVCYLLTPYSRIAVVDSGQLVPAALVVTAVLYYERPIVAGLLIGLAAGWMPPCLGLLPLWAAFYFKRGSTRFLAAALAMAGVCALAGWAMPPLAAWARALGARSLLEAGLTGLTQAPHGGSFWTEIDPVYRLPVLIGYGILVATTAWWPAEKNLGELIALSAALLVASQFWYLDEGGTMILLYLPLVLLMMFRPNLASRRPPLRHVRSPRSEPSPSATASGSFPVIAPRS